jgi:hypothetical protein
MTLTAKILYTKKNTNRETPHRHAHTNIVLLPAFAAFVQQQDAVRSGSFYDREREGGKTKIPPYFLLCLS